MNLFDVIRQQERAESPHPWRPSAPPCLDRVKEIELDVETDGLRWWDGHRPIGMALRLPDGSSQYLPWGHRGGGNLAEETVLRWAQRELRGKRITNLNTRFDIHMLREWGVDLEAQDNEVSDVGHYAALLDDHRKRFNLEELGQDYLGVGKGQMEHVEKSKMADAHAGEVEAYARQDVMLVGALKEKMWPLLTAEGLHSVRQLEDEVIYPVCEMEKNGAPINVPLLEKWVVDCEQEYLRCLWRIHRETGLKINPNSQEDKTRLFHKLGLPIPQAVEIRNGVVHKSPTFRDAEIKHIKHPIIQLMRRAAKLDSVNSKYLKKYLKCVGPDGVIRYALHQLRAEKDESDGGGGEAGTVTGRFSSSEIVKGYGVNIQQVMKVAKQRVMFGFDEKDSSHDDEIFCVRQLHIPRSGLWLSADAKQIEYRIFASYAGSPKVLAAYKENPDLKFHDFMWDLIRPFKPDITYRQQKDLNFAKIYAAGTIKLAVMMEFITPSQGVMLRHENASRHHPMLAQALEIENIYAREVPETGFLIAKASNLAKTRGYVKTVLGRRQRFPGGRRLHKALNGIIQGGAADINKRKLVELHKERKYTQFLMRYTIHDEVDGDIPDQEHAKRVSQILDAQSFPELKVPILWDVSTGVNWKECA